MNKKNSTQTVNLFQRLLKSIGLNRTVLALSVARMADAMGNSILFILIPLYIAKLPDVYVHFPLPVLVGILISVYGLISAIVQPFMGTLVDKFGRRKPLIQLGLGLIGISTFAFVFAANFVDLLVLRTIQGIAVAITIPASMALMAAVTEKKTRGGSMGVYSTFRMVGFALGPVLGGYLKVHYGFNASFYAGAAFILLAVFLIQIWVKDVPVIAAKRTNKRLKIFDLTLMNPGILSAGLATFLMASAFSMVTTLENEFNHRLGINAIGFGAAFSTLMIGRLIFQVPLGKLSDYIGRKPLILVGLLIMAPFTAYLGEVTSLTQLVIVRLLQGVAAAGIAAPAFAIAADLSQSGGEGRQMSVITMGFGLGIAIGPLLAGLLAVFFFELPFLTAGILCVLGAYIVYRFMPETIESKHAFFKKHASQS